MLEIQTIHTPDAEDLSEIRMSLNICNTSFIHLNFQVTVTQYDNPINCYSDETIDDMTDGTTTWRKTEDQVQTIQPEPNKFNAEKSAVLAVLTDHEKGVTFAR